MELVVDIPDNAYTHIKVGAEDSVDEAEVMNAIRNGTPLPKGYGEIVDIQPLMRGLYEEMCTGEVTYTTSEVYKMLEEECKVIIKADKKGDTQ